MAVRDPWTGARVVEQVWRREELFEGPWLERAPDLVLQLALDAGYSYNLMPSGTAPPGTGAWRRLSEGEYLGRKGRSLPGSHRERGLIADASATLLARMDVAPAPDARGRVLWEILHSSGTARTMPDVPVRRGKGDPERVEQRLRALGYID